jgi:hypothetical protein
MSDLAKDIARRDFLAGLVLMDEVYLPLFERADQEVAISMADIDQVGAARAVAKKAKNREMA